ncbi:MAG: HlyD family efflux transporter periplasmic adaptor subunit [Clostridia bacterium]|nr:HlyD family efflux transporter periplasmic adaptor subunit [Clostridia bacterium]
MREHKALKTVLCIIAIVFIVHQLYSSVYKPITTVTAENYTAVDGYNINAVIIREEKLITSNTSGALHFVLSDGERVAKDGTIANIYSNADASVTVSRIAQLDERIADMEQIHGYNDVEAADIGLINNKVNNSLNVMMRGIASGNFSSVADDAADLLTDISRRQMVTGEQTDFSAQINELKTERDSLNASLPQPIGSITAQQSGYYVSNVDGYENTLKCDDIEKITPEYLDKLTTDSVSIDTIGKIVSGYTWYIAAKVDLNESVKYKVGDRLTLKTALKSSPELDVTVEKINTSKNDSVAVLVFSCQQMNSELATIRKGGMTIIKNTYEGLKIPTKALRFQDEKTGVFVRSGTTLKFVGVKVLYRTDEYIICEQQVSDDTVLRLYDDVVVKGRQLYDGKVVD